MFRPCKWLALVFLGLCNFPIFAQAPEGWQFGTGIGAQRFSNNVDALAGLGVHASIGRWLAPRLGASLALDYAALPFRQKVQGVTNIRESNVFGAALQFDYSASAHANINPYLKLGGGLESMQVGSSSRQIYAAGIAGGGVRIRLQPQIALHVHGDYHLIDTRPLQGFSPDQPPNGYFTARVGFTFFTRREESPDEGLLSETVDIEEVSVAELLETEGSYQSNLAPSDSADVSSEQNQPDRFSFEEEVDSEAESSAMSFEVLPGNPESSLSAAQQLESEEFSLTDEFNSEAEAAFAASESSQKADSVAREENSSSSTDGSFDLSALEERVQQLENEAAASELTATAGNGVENEPASPDLTALEARLQKLEELYDSAPPTNDDAAMFDEPAAAKDQDEVEQAGAFAERLDHLASKHEEPHAVSTELPGTDTLENLEEEPAGDFTSFEQRLQLLEGESDQIDNAPEELELAVPEVPAAQNGFAEKNLIPEAASIVSTFHQNQPFAQSYESALHSFYLGDYSEAVQLLSQLTNDYPNHILASNCYYWLGEAQLQTNNLQEAIAAFNRVLAFEKSLKKDNALLMLGQCYLILKRAEEARTAFNRVIAEYPASEAVAKAQEYLRRL